MAFEWDGVTWEENIKYLGVIFNNDLMTTINKNFTEIVEKAKKHATFHQYRKLSYRGKALLLNSLILSKLWFVATVFYIPPWANKQIEKLCFEFIWNNKKDQVTRDRMYLPTWEGGIGLLNPKHKVTVSA